MKYSFHVTIWNEDVERSWTVLATSHKEARAKAIKTELDLGTPLYKIHVESVKRW